MRYAILATSLAAGLVACGGSESSSVSYPSVNDYSPVAVSNSNAASLYAGTGATVTDNSSSPTDLPSDALTYTPSSALNSLRDVTELYPTFAANSRTGTALFDSATCQGGGSLDATGTTTFEFIGDYITVDFNGCVVSGATLNGGFTMRLTTGQGFDPSVELDFSHYSANTGGQTITIHGDLAFDNWDFGSTQYATMTSNSLNVRDSLYGDSVMSNLSISGELDTNGDHRLTMAYTFGSDELGGRMDVSTPQTISTLSGDDWPTTGELRIDGDNSSFLSLHANTGDVNTVLMTVHNGASTTANTVTWDSLSGADFGEYITFE